MVADQIGFVKPLNDVVQGRYMTERLKVGANATAASMKPGIHVIFDVNDYSVKEGGAAGHVIGILGYGDANADYKPATRDTAYAVGDEVPVHNGSFRARVYVSETVVKGDPLVAIADGKFELADVNIVKTTGDAHITGDDEIEGSFGTQGPVICRAAESRTGAGVVWAIMSI